MNRIEIYVCSKCRREVKSVHMCRTFWTAQTGWVKAPWSECCDARVKELRELS